MAASISDEIDLETCLENFIRSRMGNSRKRSREEPVSNMHFHPSPNLHISDLSPQTTAEEVSALFKPYCKVIDVVIKTTFGFVHTTSVEGATGAMFSLQGTDKLHGKALKISYAKDKTMVSPQKRSSASTKETTPQENGTKGTGKDTQSDVGASQDEISGPKPATAENNHRKDLNDARAGDIDHDDAEGGEEESRRKRCKRVDENEVL